MTTIDRTSNGVVLWFDRSDEVEDGVRRFVRQEQQCCQFWGLEVLDGAELGLRWDGPPATAGFMDALVDYLEGRLPIGSLLGSWS